MLDRPSPSMNDRLAMHNANALKLGLFGVNCSSGRSATKVPERWSASWPDCLALARMARRRRHRLPAADRPLEGLRRRHRPARQDRSKPSPGRPACSPRPRASPCSAPCMRRCFIRSSPPSRCVTADHVGEGRFGLNIVAGWNEGEFEMFGVQQREHETRYAYAQEWIDAIKQAWGPQDDFDFDGEYIKLKKVRAKPKPYGGTRPLIMNAGSSGAGPGFRAAQLRRLLHRHLDLAPGRRCDREDGRGHQGRGARASAARSRCSRSARWSAARRRRRPRTTTSYAIIDMADWGSVDRMMEIKNLTPQTLGEKAFAEKRILFRLARGRRLSVRRHAGPHRRRACHLEPQRHPRHRLLDGQLSRRVAALPRRGAAAAAADGRAREELMKRSPAAPGDPGDKPPRLSTSSTPAASRNERKNPVNAGKMWLRRHTR